MEVTTPQSTSCPAAIAIERTPLRRSATRVVACGGAVLLKRSRQRAWSRVRGVGAGGCTVPIALYFLMQPPGRRQVGRCVRCGRRLTTRSTTTDCAAELSAGLEARDVARVAVGAGGTGSRPDGGLAAEPAAACSEQPLVDPVDVAWSESVAPADGGCAGGLTSETLTPELEAIAQAAIDAFMPRRRRRRRNRSSSAPSTAIHAATPPQDVERQVVALRWTPQELAKRSASILSADEPSNQPTNRAGRTALSLGDP